MRLFAVILKLRKLTWLCYAVAILCSLLALWVRMSLGSVFEGYPFLTFFLAVLVSAVIGGLGPGLLAGLLCWVFAQYMLIQPIYSFEILDVSNWIALAAYGLTVVIMVGLVHWLTLAYQSQLDAQAQLAELNRTLEARVAERTAELHTEAQERAAAQGQVRQLQKMDAIGQLTGGIAHDFNNMLAIVIGSLDLAQLRAEGLGDERLGRYVGAAQEGAQRAALLTSRLMAFSRQQTLAPQAVDVNRLVQGMLDLLQRTLGDHIQVTISLCDRPWHCFADPSQLENALLNLSINARDAMATGGKLTITTANVELDAAATEAGELMPGQYIRVTVQDSGAGMTADVLERAFEPFYTTKGVGKGTGLGLSQVYGYLKQSGGSASIRSTPGDGTTVVLHLPRFSAASVVADGHAGRIALPRVQTGQAVLVVEDEPQVRQVAVDALQQLGYAVTAADSAPMALEQLRLQPDIDLLLTDVVMPGMSGPELVSEAHKIKHALRILYMSGYAPDPQVRTQLGLHAQVMQKPFTLDQLAHHVHDALTR